MKLRKRALKLSPSAHAKVYTNSEGSEILISYNTPVAGYIHGVCFWEANNKYSMTTSRHVSLYNREHGYPKTQPKSVEQIKAILRDRFSGPHVDGDYLFYTFNPNYYPHGGGALSDRGDHRRSAL